MLYDIAFLLFSIFYLPTLIFKSKLHGDFGQRLGRYPTTTRMRLAAAKRTIWIQAVSVGEVALCRGLVPQLRKRYPDDTIVMSTITKTGQEMAKKLFSDQAIIIYFPLDLSWIAARAVSVIKPKLYVMVETEIWPNVISAVARSGAKIVVVNGRISDRSLGKYMMARPFLKRTLGRISSFCMQSELDAKRIISIGASADRVRVTGSMKFDAAMGADESAAAALAAAMDMGIYDKLIVAGSTHPGEEEPIIEIFGLLNSKIPGLKLLIAPRHIDRCRDIESIARRSGFEPVRLSGVRPGNKAGSDARVYILDTIGKLSSAYSLATLVFVGGSLVPRGGQNPIEPAALGKAVMFGPHMFNFREITSSMTESGSAVMVSDASEACELAELLLRDADRRTVLGQRAREFVGSKRGATERNIGQMAHFL